MTKPKSLISLFTGAGGLDIGLEIAGFETLVASELEPYACESLRANKVLTGLTKQDFPAWFNSQLEQRCYKNVAAEEISVLHKRLQKAIGSKRFLQHATIIEGDIRQVSSEALLSAAKVERGQIDLIAGGPPCQPFSRAGKRENVDCDNGRLFKEFVRIVDDIRPRWFLFENVKGLVITKADVLELACNTCGCSFIPPFSTRIGETLSENHVCPKCGATDLQQDWKTERGGSLKIILNEFESLGYKCYSAILNAADFGAPQSRERLFIVGSRDGEHFEWPRPTHSKPSAEPGFDQRELFSLEQTALPQWRSMFEVLWKSGHSKYGKLDKDKAVLWVKNVVRPHDEPVTWSLSRPSPTIGAHQSAKLALAPYGVPQEQLNRQQWHVLGRRQKDLPPVFVEHEYLSDSELLALQTFPYSWYLFGTRMQRAFQIGNAVPPILASAVGAQIMKALTTSNIVAPRNKAIANKKIRKAS
jgi:DNA (cytosine-5)-methyltransferase 1